MKLSCLQENLSKGLGIVGRSVAIRPVLPIIQNVLIATDQSRLKLTATNLEMAVTCWIGAKVEEEGVITIPARLFTEYINFSPSDQVELSLSQNILKIKSGRFSSRINGLNAEDFPPIPQVTDGIVAKIEAEALRQAITHVVFAAASEDNRPVLTGIQAEFKQDKLVLAAADGFRLAVYTAPLEAPVTEESAVIIPAKSLNELSRFLIDQQEPVEIIVNKQKTQVMFRLKDIEVVSQLIQGAFPNYSQLIPQSYGTRAVIDVAEFQRAAKMSSIFGSIVRLILTPGADELNPGKMMVSARADEVGENEGEIDALIDGEKSQIAFNVKSLSEVLGVVRKNQVALETTTSSSPGVIRPVGVDNYVHVIMPMFVQW